MLYTRSSFIRYLTTKHDCEIINLNDRRANIITIKNGPATAYILATGRDVIDYEEIFIVCKKLWLPLPGDRDLEKVE